MFAAIMDHITIDLRVYMGNCNSDVYRSRHMVRIAARIKSLRRGLIECLIEDDSDSISLPFLNSVGVVMVVSDGKSPAVFDQPIQFVQGILVSVSKCLDHLKCRQANVDVLRA